MNDKPINDGGPAFPGREYESRPFSMGMSLRDYFAGQAMQMASAWALQAVVQGIAVPTSEELSQRSYEWADSMLKARNKK